MAVYEDMDVRNVTMNVVDSRWIMMAQGDAREGKWRGNWQTKWVANTLHTTSERGVSSITTADAQTSAAIIDWTDGPVDLNGFVRFAERRNLVSARVPLRFKWPLLWLLMRVTWLNVGRCKCERWTRGHCYDRSLLPQKCRCVSLSRDRIAVCNEALDTAHSTIETNGHWVYLTWIHQTSKSCLWGRW